MESKAVFRSVHLAGHFIPSSKGNILLTQFGELTDTVVLCAPSIVEELNLARAVVAKQAMSLARQDLPVVVVDYIGCGDSEGEFEQVTADDWLEDIVVAGQWLLRHGVKRIILWGVRFGSLLLMAHQQRLAECLPLVCQLHWQPVTSGKVFASQFIRIKQASELTGNNQTKINWRERILAGDKVEVAGYAMTSEMLNSWEKLIVSNDFIPFVPFAWVELNGAQPTPAITRYTKTWPEHLYRLHCQPGPSFWQVPEVFDLPELYPACLMALSEVSV